MGLSELSKVYIAMGAGGISLIALLWVLGYLMTKITPLLEGLKEDNQSHKEVIRNNTEAIREISRSNENVANALSLLENSFGSLLNIIEKHDKKADDIENEIIKIREATRNCSKR